MPAVKNTLLQTVIFSGCFLLSAFIFANAYEIAFTRDVPFVNAINTVDTGPLKRYTAAPLAVSSAIGHFGVPTTLRLPLHNKRIPLVEGRSARHPSDGAYLARASSGHFLLVSEPKDSYFGDVIVYLRRSYRTLDAQTLSVGDNIFIDTDRDWRYVFRITDFVRLDTGQQFIMQDDETPTLTLYAYDEDSASAAIYSASLINLQDR